MPDSDEGASTAGESTDWASASDGEADAGGRDVEVPMALYKRVTVYGTLVAIVAVLVGFLFLDAATLRASFLRRFVVGVLSWLGVVPGDDLLAALFALTGVALIAFGSGVYVLSTRFTTEGMGKSKEDTDEHSDNG
jgi:hypothetical protein